MKNKKKVAFVTPIYLPSNLSGSGVVVKQMAELLAREGVDVSVVTSNALTARYWYDPVFGRGIKKKYEVINGVKIYRLSCNFFISSISFVLVRFFYKLIPDVLLNELRLLHSGPYLIGFKKVFKRKQFDVIYSSPLPLYINKQVAKLADNNGFKSKFIIRPDFHESVSDYKNPLLKSIFNKFDIIHVLSNSEKNVIKKWFDQPDSKFAIIPNSIWLNMVLPENILRKKSDEFIKRYNLSGRKKVLFIGNKGEMKGAVDTLFALDDLYKKDDSYVFIAAGNETLEWRMSLAAIDKACLLDFNYVSEEEKEVLFNVCDIYCMPSKSDAFGITYLEAWSKKKPVIGANTKPIEELIDGVGGGVLVSFGDREGIKNTIEKLMNDIKMRAKFGEAGFDATSHRYNFLVVRKKYLELLNSESQT